MLACTYAVVEESPGFLGLVSIVLLFAARGPKNTDNAGTRQRDLPFVSYRWMLFCFWIHYKELLWVQRGRGRVQD